MLLQDELQEMVVSGSVAERSGEWDDALNQYAAALQQASANGEFPRVSSILRAIGRLHVERGEYDRAAEVFDQSLDKALAAADSTQVAASLNCRGVVEQLRGNIETARDLYHRASELAEQNGDAKLRGLVEQNLGTLSTVGGEYDRALEHGQNALAMFRRIGDDLSAARVLNNIGMLHLDTQEYGHAELSFRSSLTIADRLRDTGLRVKVQANRAELALRRQDYEAAQEYCDEAFRLYTKLGSESGLSETYKLYGILHRETNNSALANTHFRLALKLAQSCGDRLLEAESERERALLFMQEGRNREALTALTQAHRMFQELKARREVADVEQKLQRVERIYLRVVEMLESEMTITFDPSMVQQYQRVAQLATQLASLAGFEGRDLTWLRIGAFLYDVGKRSVPADVLNKRGKLDGPEWEVVKQHVYESEQVVAELDPPWDMVPMVRHHHEHWDGTGYPDKLSGEEIPLSARILCIADAYTAMTSPRSFRKPMSKQEALLAMEKEAGTTFDPKLFAMFRTLIESN